jgi:hypothetical protein
MTNVLAPFFTPITERVANIMEDVLFFQRMSQVHEDVANQPHANILFKEVKIGTLDFYATFLQTLEQTGTTVPNWKQVFRAQRLFHLAKYFDYSLNVDGERIECGVLRGFSAKFLAEVARMRDPDFAGRHFHVVDSFQGLSMPTREDALSMRTLPDGRIQLEVGANQGHFATPIEHVRQVLSGYPEIGIHAGWIPEVFAKLPDAKYAFVHIDVDLYEPTLACLEYFWPRLAKGGVIVNDDYRAPLFPGGGRAWDKYCDDNKLKFHILTTGQAALIKA